MFSWKRQSLSLDHHTDKERIYWQKLMESLLAMAWFVEARDPYTGGHLWRVSRYARMLADQAGLSETEAVQASLGGFLHDLGKIGIPDAILRKPGPLTNDEYDVIKTHPDVGLRMLAGHPMAALAADAVGLHHERPDGKGYPNGLSSRNSESDIPLAARIVGICDAFDAMVSYRPYRTGIPTEEVQPIWSHSRTMNSLRVLSVPWFKLSRRPFSVHPSNPYENKQT